jgi:outer membrane protein assembly factor BamB
MKIYLCYAASDQEFAKKLQSRLGLIGYTCTESQRQADKFIFIESRSVFQDVESQVIANLRGWIEKHTPRNWFALLRPRLVNDSASTRPLTRDLVRLSLESVSEKSVPTHQRQVFDDLSRIQRVSFEKAWQNSKIHSDLEFSSALTELLTAIAPSEAYTVFISYSRADSEAIGQIKTGLEEKPSFRVWLDTRNIAPASGWQTEVRRGIAASRYFLAFVSSSWLGSHACDDEWQTAVELNKIIIPVHVPQPPVVLVSVAGESEKVMRPDWTQPIAAPNPQSAADVLKRRTDNNPQEKEYYERFRRRDRFDSGDEDKVFEAVNNKWNQLTSNPVQIEIDDFDSTKEGELNSSSLASVREAILSRTQEKQAQVDSHTRWLIPAFDYVYKTQGREARLLSLRQLITALRWSLPSRRQHPRPTSLHWLHIWRSLLAIGVRSLLLISVVAVALILFLLQNARQRELLLQEVQRAFNSSSQFAARHVIPLEATPSSSLLVNQYFWIMDVSTGQLHQVGLDGSRVNPAVDVGLDAYPPVKDGAYLWVSSRGNSRLTRVDTSGQSPPVSLSVGMNPGAPVVLGDYVWVLSTLSRELWRIPRLDLEALPDRISLHPDSNQFIPAGDAIWTFQGTVLTRIDAENLSSTPTPGFDRITALFNVGENLWVQTESGLHRVDMLTGVSLASINRNTPLTPGVLVGDRLWAFSRNAGEVLILNADDLQVVTTIPLDFPREIRSVGDQVWVFTDSGFTRFDSQSRLMPASVRTLNIPDLEMLSINNVAWLISKQAQTAYLVDQETGDVFREIRICADLTLPLYDGTNAWFNCPTEQSLLGLPASLTTFAQFGVDTFATTNVQLQLGVMGGDSQIDHRPLSAEGKLWITQESTGRLLAFDLTNGLTEVVANLAGEILPLVAYQDDLWTGLRASGELIRIDPSRFVAGSPSAYVQTIPTGYPLAFLRTSLTPAGDRLWISHDTSIPDVPNFSLVDPVSMTVTQQLDLGLVVTGTFYESDSLWVTVSGVGDAELLRLDARSGDILTSVPPLLTTTYGAWPPVQVNSGLWFPFVTPDVLNVWRDTLEQCNPEIVLPDSRYRFAQLELQTQSWLSDWPLPCPITRPVWDGRYFWASYLNTAPVLTDAQDPSAGSVMAINPDTGNLLPDSTQDWRFCSFPDLITAEEIYATSSNIYHIGEWILVGCLRDSRDLAVFRAGEPEKVAVYKNVGIYPWQPVSDGRHIWIVFRDTDNMAILDATTGALIRVVPLQPGPAAPILWQDQLWIYSASADVLQATSLEVPDA